MTSSEKASSASVYMRRALVLARKALGHTSPNPAVGAVLVRAGQVVGEGYTQPAGNAHAEVVALAQAGRRARGATLYVTLEPCCHTGRTPPCTSAIAAAGVKEVRFSTIDPNPLVAGKGRENLEQHGIKTVVGEMAEASRRLNEAYFKFITTGLPFVTAKFASSLDGKIATRTGDSRWVTSEAARRQANRLRAMSDAVVVGIGTVLADDPLLTVRDRRDRPLPRQPLRVVVDSRCRTPATALLLAQPGQVLLAVANPSAKSVDALKKRGVEVVSFPGEDGAVGLKALLTHLGQRNVTSVLVEGGAALLGSFFDQGLVDKVVAFVSPVIIGGRAAIPAVAGRGVNAMTDALRLRDVLVRRVGADLMVQGYPADSDGGPKKVPGLPQEG